MQLRLARRFLQFDDVRLDLTIEDAELTARVTAGTTPLKWIRLYWRYDRNEPVRIMGDAWERGYGDLEWRGIVPERHMPWYMLISNGSDQNPVYTGRRIDAFGVKVQPSAICDWQYDGCGITLNLDIRCGGDGVILGGRMLEIATILSCTYTDCSAFAAGRQFCRAMCRTPRLPDKPVYGFNNWYYAYGRCDADEVIADAGLLLSLPGECRPSVYGDRRGVGIPPRRLPMGSEQRKISGYAQNGGEDISLQCESRAVGAAVDCIEP